MWAPEFDHCSCAAVAVSANCDRSRTPNPCVCLCPAGKHLDDAQRTLEQYGLAYWHSKFPHWPLKIRKH
jgi:hypothetical protein